MKKQFALAIVVSLVSSFSAQARSDFRDRDHDGIFDRDHDHRVCEKVRKLRPSRIIKKLKPKQLQCGDVVTESMTLANDLICPNTTGFALNIMGQGIVFNGNGHKIVAPQAAAGLFVSGDSVTVAGVKVNGVEQGYGILAYDTDNLKITLNDFSRNLMGIMVYAENKQLKNVDIVANLAVENSLFGIRTGSDGAGAIVEPNLRFNNLSRTGLYGLFIKAKSYTLEGKDQNVLDDSVNGAYLVGGDFKIQNFDTSKSGIQKIHVFVDSATDLRVKNINVSSPLPPTPNQDRIGLDLYRVAKFRVEGLTAKGNDAGIKLENELGASPTGTVTKCKFVDNKVAGILVDSYDGSPYGDLYFLHNKFRKMNDMPTVWVGAATPIGANSILDGESPRGRDDRDHGDHDDHDEHNDRDEDSDCDRR